MYVKDQAYTQAGPLILTSISMSPEGPYLVDSVGLVLMLSSPRVASTVLSFFCRVHGAPPNFWLWDSAFVLIS